MMWLPRPLYEAVHYIYLGAGAALLGAAFLTARGLSGLLLAFGAIGLTLGLVLWMRRRDYRASQREYDRTRSTADALQASRSSSASTLYAESPEVGEDLVEKARGTVEEGRKEADSSGVAVECHVREGLAYKAIVDLAKEKKIEAIIMGSHGRTGLRRLLMGSVVEKVIGHTPCPVLVVKR